MLLCRVALKHPDWASGRIITATLRGGPAGNGAEADQAYLDQYSSFGKNMQRT
jgi:hypothetical protein